MTHQSSFYTNLTEDFPSDQGVKSVTEKKWEEKVSELMG